MDPALLREREAFKRRAMATPTVEKKAKTESSFAAPKDIKKPRPASAAPKIDASNYKTMSGSSQYRFGVLAKIVKHMRTRHQEGDDHPLTLDEILDETNQLDIGSSVKTWLQGEALRNNPKIEVTPDGRFLFKSVFKIKDGKSLMRLLKQHDLKGLGGVLLDDVQESLPHCDKVLKNRASEIIFITRPNDKKKILFYNDRTANFQVDEDFQKLWRAVTVDAMDDAKIDEYLEKQGIRSMQDHGPKKPLLPKRKKLANKKRQFKKPRDNEHLADVLETYEDNTLTQSNAVQEIKQNN
ncbi:AGAP005382-PA [Anopheles gambiae str. PEST]|uniref:Transcription initiation factor IIE subunit beta n=4 Tax=gambiae species complex TaxID=44542 RepID=Q7Q7C7_ANOGA|nr:general transcription factor IIE subunit 2 [Anopheles coluzzii]XP_315392.3 general transcription factor IIE subunit 2 [Anopheles gambiae]EAA11794.3 AGAP005382-PA [Anopheles gambiae str. PEST]